MATNKGDIVRCSFCRKDRSTDEVSYIHLFFDKNKLFQAYEIAVSPEYLHSKVNFVCCKYCLKSFFDLFNIDIHKNNTKVD